MLLVAENISKKYREKPLMDKITLGINEGDKIGVIGVNGTGKSTLLKILAGLESADDGNIIKNSGLKVGYLPQNPVFPPKYSILECALQDLTEEEKEERSYEAKALLSKLGINDLSTPVTLLSGGQRKRVAIAKALISKAELLILDEPTNHIDNETVTWLEEYLTGYKGALVMVTHDRYFLDRISNKIAELQRGKLSIFECNYSKYLEYKLERAEMEQATERKRQTLLKKELEWISRGARARSTKQKFRVQRYEELSNQSGPAKEQTLKMDSLSSRLGKSIISAEGVSKAYHKPLINNFTYTLLRNDRIGIVGENGCGKSTLLKIIGGMLPPDKGEVKIGQTVKIGYFSQECDEMDLSARAIDYVKDIAQWIDLPDGTVSASQLMEQFLFTPDLQYTQIEKLSGGERRRLYLLGILISAPNVLLLDEPTNDLDIETLSVLEDYLDSFSGAVIAVSHDRYFLDRIAQNIFAFEEGGNIKAYVGGYSGYIKLRPSPVTVKEETIKAPAEKPRLTEKVRFSYKEQQEFEKIDSEIAELEQKICNLSQEIEQNSSDFAKLSLLMTQKEEVEQMLNEKMERWLYLNELAEQIEMQKNK